MFKLIVPNIFIFTCSLRLQLQYTALRTAVYVCSTPHTNNHKTYTCQYCMYLYRSPDALNVNPRWTSAYCGVATGFARGVHDRTSGPLYYNIHTDGGTDRCGVLQCAYKLIRTGVTKLSSWISPLIYGHANGVCQLVTTSLH